MESIWPSFRLDPRDPQHAPLRASDADRAIVSAVLADAYADGRLTAEEHDERQSATLAARTLGELPPLLADLVGPSGRPTGGASGPVAVAAVTPSNRDLHAAAVRQHLRDTGQIAAGAATPFVVCLLIWLFTGGGYFWPMWLLIPLVVAITPSVLGAPAAIRTKERRLQRQDGTHDAVEAPEPPREIDG